MEVVSVSSSDLQKLERAPAVEAVEEVTPPSLTRNPSVERSAERTSGGYMKPLGIQETLNRATTAEAALGRSRVMVPLVKFSVDPERAVPQLPPLPRPASPQIAPSKHAAASARDVYSHAHDQGWVESSDSSVAPAGAPSHRLIRPGSWVSEVGSIRTARFPSVALLAPPSIQSILHEIASERFATMSTISARVLVKRGIKVLEAALDYDRFGFRFDPDRNLRYEPDPPAVVLKRREAKWDKMLSEWDTWIAKNTAKVRSRCRKGIPPSRRAAAWYVISGARALSAAHPADTFETLVARAPAEVPAAVLQLIGIDVPRSFPEHRLLETGGGGLNALEQVLRAYAVFNPEVAYCQGMNFVAGTLLIAGLTAPQAFWTLASLLSYHMAGYFNAHLSQLRMDISMFGVLIRDHVPLVAKQLEEHTVEPIHFATRWFMSAFAHSLPWDAVLRVWDRFLFEGSQVLFHASIAILKYRQVDLAHASSFDELLEILQPMGGVLNLTTRVLMKSMAQHQISSQTLVKAHTEAMRVFSAVSGTSERR